MVAKLKDAAPDPGVSAFLDPSSELIGELRLRGEFLVLGRVRGKVVSESALVVAESAIVEADLDGATVSIRGKVTGHVTGRRRIEVLSGAQVRGHLSSPKLVIEDGAFFEGECDMGAPPTAEIIRLPQPPSR